MRKEIPYFAFKKKKNGNLFENIKQKIVMKTRSKKCNLLFLIYVLYSRLKKAFLKQLFKCKIHLLNIF